MELPIYQLDAFAGRLFAGNPAAVVILDRWLPDATMQAIAAENNLAETAFIVPDTGVFHLRWFTPEVEIDLCGHATLASAHVLFHHGYTGHDTITFRYPGGILTVSRDGEHLAMDFPSRPPTPIAPSAALARALGATPEQLLESRDLLAVFETQEEIETLRPDFAALTGLEAFAVIVSSPGRSCDFVSRFFAPRAGIPEDPATGSAHCTLIPYWSARLGKRQLHALQLSRRVGEFFCEDRGERVTLRGRVFEYLRGRIEIPEPGS